MAKPALDCSMEPEDAVNDIFERCPALLKFMQRMLSDASGLPWIPPPAMHTLQTSGATNRDAAPQETDPTPTPTAPAILSVRSCESSRK